jgi:hypothetical protein
MAGDPCPQVVIGGVETPQDIEHQDPIGHRAPDVVKSISHALHPPTELTNGEVPCSKVQKDASSWRARNSALPRNGPSNASQACRAVPP